MSFQAFVSPAFSFMNDRMKWILKGVKIGFMMNTEFDKVLILAVLMACFGCLVFYKGDHEMLIYFEGAATTVLGCLLGMVRNKDK